MLRFNTPLSGEFRCGFDTCSSPRDDDNGPSLSEPPPASRRRTEENLEERLGNGARSGDYCDNRQLQQLLPGAPSHGPYRFLPAAGSAHKGSLVFYHRGPPGAGVPGTGAPERLWLPSGLAGAISHGGRCPPPVSVQHVDPRQRHSDEDESYPRGMVFRSNTAPAKHGRPGVVGIKAEPAQGSGPALTPAPGRSRAVLC
ncbi:unnamed protein product [Gadus morhua 'NCC']